MKYFRGVRLLNSIFLILILVACNQSPKPIESDHSLTAKESSAIVTCSQVNTVRGFLQHRNFILAAQCFGWDFDYPRFYESLVGLDDDAWNFLMTPVDLFYFSDFEKRDQYLAHFRRLDTEESLDDFATILDAYTDTNLNDIVFRILSDENKEIPRSSLKEMLNILNARPETIRAFGNSFKIINQALKGDGKNIFQVFAPLVRQSNFRDARLQLLDAVATTFKSENLSPLERFVMRRVLRVHNEHGRLWLYDWIQDIAKSPETFIKLLNYSTVIHPSSFSDYENLIGMRPEIGCYSGGVYQGLTINIDDKLRFFVRGLVEMPLIDFFDRTNSIAAELYVANETCDVDDNFGANNIKLLSTMRSVMNLLNEEDIYKLFGFLHQNVFEGEDELGEEGLTFFLEMHIGRTYRALTHMNDVIINKNRNKFYVVLLNIIKDISQIGYNEFAYFVETALKEENLKTISELGDIWLKLNAQEKQAFLNLVDVFFTEDINYVSLLNFFEKFVDDFEFFIPKMAERFASSDEAKEKTLDSLLKLSSALKGPTVLADLRNLFSRNGIIRIVNNLSLATNPGDPDATVSPIVPGVMLPSLDTIVYDEIQRCGEQYSFEVCEKVYQCFRELSADNHTLFSLAQNTQLSCLELDTQYYALRLIQYLNTANAKYKELFSSDLVTPESMFGPKVMGEAQVTMAALHKMPSSDSGNYLQLIINTLKEHTFHLLREDGGYGYIPEFEDIVEFLSSAIRLETPSLQAVIQEMKLALKDLTSDEISEYSNLLSLAMRDYVDFDWEPETYIQDGDCESQYKQTFRLANCASPDLVKNNIKRILEILERTYDGRPSAGELLVRSVHPEAGLVIPTVDEEGEKVDRKYVINLKNFLLYVWDTNSYGSELKYLTGNDSEDFIYSPWVSYAQRTEIVVTDASFFGNYFGLFFLNSTAGEAYKYKKKSEANRDLYKTFSDCINNPLCGIFTGPFNFGSDAKWLSKNAVTTFDSLIDVNNEYPHKDGIYRHGDFLKTFLSIFTQSSPEEALYTGIFRLPTKKWEKIHNGEVIFLLAEMGAFKGFGRYFKDRISDDRDAYDDFVNTYQFQRVDNRLFSSFPLEPSIQVMKNLLTNLKGEDGDLNQFVDNMVDWINGQSYQDLREFEQMLADILVISTYLGVDNTEDAFRGEGEQYADNGPFDFFKTLEGIIPFANGVYRYWPGDSKGVDLILKLAKPIRFFKEKLLPESPRATRTTYYHILNKTFKIVKKALLKGNRASGFEALGEMIKRDPRIVTKFETALDSSIIYLERLGKRYDGNQFLDDKFRLTKTADFLDALVENPKIKTQELRNWIYRTEVPYINGVTNSEHRKIRKIVQMLGYKEDGITLLRKAMMTSFVDDKSILDEFIDHIFPLIQFKDNPPEVNPLP